MYAYARKLMRILLSLRIVLTISGGAHIGIGSRIAEVPRLLLPDPMCYAGACINNASSTSSANVGSAGTSGMLWNAVKGREYTHSRIFGGAMPLTQRTHIDAAVRCERWAVITTIFAPTKLVLQLASLSAWCLVIVGDEHSLKEDMYLSHIPAHLRNSRVVYLSADTQRVLPFRVGGHLAWNHFGRKNIGFMYAIALGASLIYDTDDDNELLELSALDAWADMLDAQRDGSIIHSRSSSIETIRSCSYMFNPYPLFGSRREGSDGTASSIFAWPRGMPLELLRSCNTVVEDSSRARSRTPISGVGVLQSLANGDPDVDALYRLRHYLPIEFGRIANAGAVDGARALDGSTTAPFNAQATLWRRDAFWAMLLPVTVHGRVSDIWRSFIAQRIMRDVGLRVAFTQPWVRQVRNPHAYLADFQAELPLFLRAGAFARWLKRWQPPINVSGNQTLLSMMEALVISCYEIGLIEIGDVKLTQAWLSDLIAVGYVDRHIAAKARIRPKGSRRPRRALKMKDMDGIIDLTDVKPNIPAAPRTSPTDARRQMRTAVCAVGQARGVLRFTSDLILTNLVAQLPSPDVFIVSTPDLPVGSSVERYARSTSRVIDSTRATLMNIATRPRHSNAFNLSKSWFDQKLATSTAHHGSLGYISQLNGTRMCLQLIREAEVHIGQQYDLAVRTRLDARWFAPLPPSIIQTVISGSAVIPKENGFGGYNDRFIISRRADFDAYARTFDDLFEGTGPWSHEWPVASLNAEKILREQLNYYHINVVFSDKIPFSLVGLRAGAADDCPISRKGWEGVLALRRESERALARRVCQSTNAQCKMPGPREGLCIRQCNSIARRSPRTNWVVREKNGGVSYSAPSQPSYAAVGFPLLSVQQLEGMLHTCTYDVSELERFTKSSASAVAKTATSYDNAMGDVLAHLHERRDAYLSLLPNLHLHATSHRANASAEGPTRTHILPLIGRCAVVGKSWNLEHTTSHNTSASEIDSHDIVIRTNGWLPTRGGVGGSKTDVLLMNREKSIEWASRITDFSADIPLPIYNPITASDFAAVLDGELFAAAKRGARMAHMITSHSGRVDASAHVYGRDHTLRILNPLLPVVAKATLSELGQPSKWPTHGMCAVLLALNTCESVSIFGMAGIKRFGSNEVYLRADFSGKRFWDGHALREEHGFYAELVKGRDANVPSAIRASRLVRARHVTYQGVDGTLQHADLPQGMWT